MKQITGTSKNTSAHRFEQQNTSTEVSPRARTAWEKFLPKKQVQTSNT